MMTIDLYIYTCYHSYGFEFNFFLKEDKIMGKSGKVLVGIIGVLFYTFIICLFIHKVFDRAEAFSSDGGKTISYFIMPSYSDSKVLKKVYPGEKEFQELLKGGDYDLIPIPAPQFEVIKKKEKRI